MMRLLITILVVFLTACGGSALTPIYTLPSNQDFANLLVLDNKDVDICIDDTFYRIPVSDIQNNIKIPAGSRITLGRKAVFYGVYKCNPFVSIIPEQGKQYFGELIVSGNSCSFDIVKESSKSPTGVTLEASMSKKQCEIP